MSNKSLPIPVQFPIVQALTSKDHNGGAVAGNWLSFSYASQIALAINTGTIGGDVTLQIQQATDASGTGAKAIELAAGSAFQPASATTNPVVDDTLLSSGDVLIPNADDDQVVVVVVNAEDLDVNGGFDHISVTGADPAVSAIFGVVAIAIPLASSYDSGEPGLRGS